jgi:hypothetical protein
MPGPEDRIAEAIRRLARKRLYIGIPQERDPRPGEPIGNASLGYVHELGSPARNIPARPHLVPGVTKALPEMTGYLREAARAALNGDSAGVDAGFEKAGIAGVNSVRLTIQAGIPPPLAPATVARRQVRTPGSTYRRQATTPADVIPLIDTGQYLAAHTWVIRDAK